MDIKLRFGTIDTMINILRLGKGNQIKDELLQLLSHDDYQDELKRYNKNGSNNGITIEEASDFISSCVGIHKIEVDNPKLKLREEVFTDFCEQLKSNDTVYPINQYELERIAEAAVQKAEFGLEMNNTLPDIEIIFSIGIGPTGGWYHENRVHLDYVQFMNPLKKDVAISILAHEIHHIGMMKVYQELWQTGLSLEEKFLTLFAGEGLAVKYGNNGSGYLTKSIYSSPSDCGLDEHDFKLFKSEFMDMFDRFRHTLRDLESGRISSNEMLNKEIREYWTKTNTDQYPRYHSRIYYFGCEIWGLLHDVYGTEKVFYVLRNMVSFKTYFNGALRLIGREDLLLDGIEQTVTSLNTTSEKRSTLGK